MTSEYIKPSEDDLESGSPQEELVEHAETEVASRGHELFGLNKNEIADLKEKIAKSEGTIRMFIHPSFGLMYKNSETDSGMSDEDYTNAANTVMAATMKVLSAKSEDSPPVIILEDDEIFQSCAAFYDKGSDSSGQDYYLIETQHSNPAPKIPKGDGDKVEYMSDQESWTLLSGVLAELGTKKIIAGGASFKMRPIDDEVEQQHKKNLETVYGPYRRKRLEHGAKNVQYSLNHCFGMALTYLSHAFDVELSNLTYPDNRKSRRNIEKGKT